MSVTSDEPTERLRVLTLNLWNVNPPLQQRLDDLVAQLRRDRPDVVALQEVSTVAGRNQAEGLAGRLGYPHVHYDAAWRDGGRQEGLALLAGVPLEPLPAVQLPEGEEDGARILQRARVRVAGRSLTVANTHLAWRPAQTDVRVAQTRRIREVLANDGEADLVLLAGDFNDEPGSAPLRVLTEPDGDGWPGLADCHETAGLEREPTWAASNPWAAEWVQAMGLGDRRLDHLLSSPELHVTDARIVFTGHDAPRVSDHFGLRVTVEPDRLVQRIP